MAGKKRSVCIIGAGFSGICAAIKIQQNLPSYEIKIIDCNADFGGTWLVNTYPGCGCDIPSHLYSFSFEPNPYWSSQYPSQPEILSYITSLARKYDLYSKSQFLHRVEKLEWIPNKSKWQTTVVKISEPPSIHTCQFDFVLLGTGEYHLPHKPDIFSTFLGPCMHTADWDSSIDLSGKTVAIIGSGSSAVQIIPSIAPNVGNLLCYQRNPCWIVSRRQFKFPPWLQRIFAAFPPVQKLYRTAIYLSHEVQYPAFKTAGFLSHFARPIGAFLGKLSLLKLKKPQLRQNLLPSYRFGCNRVCLSSDYYSALERENVEIRRQPISQVTQDSIVTKDGREDKIDVLILATGFEIHEYFGPLEILGRNGENILRKWKQDRPSIYLNMVSSDMPNLAFLHGPGVDVGHNTGLFTIECQVDWVCQLFSELDRRSSSSGVVSSCSVKSTVESAYMSLHQQDLSKTIWSSPECRKYYGTSPGLLTIVYPRSQIDYWLRTRAFNAGDFEFF